MHSEYADIKSRIDEAPWWYDEHGVPRYGYFTPLNLADIYADECALLEVGCQGCALIFLVAMSSSSLERLRAATIARGLTLKPDDEIASGDQLEGDQLARLIRSGQIHYGDPPNHVDTDHAGSTMNSVPRRVVGYWRRNIRPGMRWERDSSLEVAVGDGESVP